MKISIGINTYRSQDGLQLRQQMCMDSLRKVAGIYPEISLYNIQYENESNTFDKFTALNTLKEAPYQILSEYFNHHGLVDIYKDKFESHMDSIKNNTIPSVYEIFNTLANTECDYFIFLNDDIILSDRFIKALYDHPDYDCYPASRIHVFDLKSLDSPFRPESYSVHGFDAFCIKKEWWLKNRYNFPKYILGKPYWDTHYFTLCQLLGSTYTLNKLPAVIFHPDHQSTSCTNIDILAQYNEDIFNRDMVCKQLWFQYVYQVLLKRPTVNDIKWYQPFPQEEELEKRMFKGVLRNQPPMMKINTPLPIKLNTANKFDAFIACAPKDVIKLPFTLKSLIQFAPGLNTIHICTPKPITPVNIDFDIKYHLDKEVLPNIDPLKWRFRPNWIFQQYLKLFQNVTTTEFYLTLDVDTILNKTFNFFEDGKPVWNIGWRQNHLPYFLFNKYFLNLEKTADHTFICDMNFFNKKIIEQMLYVYGVTAEQFIIRSYDFISDGCHIAEPEIYGNFMEKYYPGTYKYRQAKQYVFGKDHSNNPGAVPWTRSEIEDIIKQKQSDDYDMIQIHSWCAGFEDHWK